jgi:hypothetical protein
MMTFRRESGHLFTNQEIANFWTDSDGPGGEELLEICDHAKPGTPLNLAIWSGYKLMRLTDGDLLEQVPDQTAPHDFGRLIFRGSNLSEDAEAMSTVRSRFWSTWSGISTQQRARIDESLLSESRAYATMVAFLEEPRNPRFRGLFESAVNASDLSGLYELPAD